MNAAELIAIASKTTGLTDLGDPKAVEGLEVLARASTDEARLSSAGVMRWRENLIGILCNRLRIVDYLKKHPELLQRTVEKPMFVFGLPRTGTTLTINLLSADRGRRCLLRWEALNPVPPARKGELQTDLRCGAQRQMLNMMLQIAPQIAAAHFEEADSPTECQYAMQLSFCAEIFDSILNIPSYSDWFLHQTGYREAFEFHKQLLQLLQEHNGGRWALKNPWHPLFLNDLTAVYPDAQLVMTHRDPAEVVGSACGLLRLVRPMYSDKVDLREIAQTLLHTFDLMIERQNVYRATHGEQSIYDIQYLDQLRDPVGTMRRLYAHFGEAFTADTEARMTRLVAENPQNKHGKHVYSLEEFGLTAEGVRTHFRDYCERFSIPLKS
ncbi:MAG: sulfotransferase [Pseudomonadota bacterium]|nr:sulfotransferase [Pseudomonadota bacterium]